MREVFVANMIQLMDQRGWKADHLVPHAGVSRATIYKYISGERSPHMETADKIAKAFGLSLSDMLTPLNGQKAESLARLSSLMEKSHPADQKAVLRLAESLSQSRQDDS